MKREDDRGEVTKLLQSTISDSSILIPLQKELDKAHLTRLGKRTTNTKRPLRISFSTSDVPLTLLRHNRNLELDIHMSSDQTPLQREILTQLRRDLIEIKKTDKNATIKYIRGVPRIITHHSKQQENSKGQ